MNQRDEVTHELISAYLDGELSADERARVEQLLAADVELQQTLHDMRSLAAGMQALPTYQLGAPFADRVLHAARQLDPSLAIKEHVAVRPNAHRNLALPASLQRWRIGISVAFTVAAALLIAIWVDHAAVDTGDGATNSGSVAVLQPDPSRELAQDPASPPAIATDQRPLDEPVAPQPLVARVPRSQVNADGGGMKSEKPASDASVQPESDMQPSRTEQQPLNAAADQMASQTPQGQAPGVKPKIGLGPGWSSQKMLLVIDVQVTPAGWEDERFERLLRDVGVVFDTNIKVEADFEKTLLDSRFFEPVDGIESEQNEQKARLAIVYVVARGGAIDQVWHQLKQDPDHFAGVSMDMALQPGDTTVFQQLQQLGNLTSSRTQQSDANPLSVARRLELSPAWNGKPIDRAAGALSARSSDTLANPNRLSPPTGTAPQLGPLSLPGEMFGGNVYAEVIFVVRCDVPRSE